MNIYQKGLMLFLGGLLGLSLGHCSLANAQYGGWDAGDDGYYFSPLNPETGRYDLCFISHDLVISYCQDVGEVFEIIRDQQNADSRPPPEAPEERAFRELLEEAT